MGNKLLQVMIGMDDLADPRLLEVDRSTRLLHVEALAWAAHYRTDGVITRASLHRLSDADDLENKAGRLVAVGIWTVTEDGWQLDWAGQITAAHAELMMIKNQVRWRRQKAHQRGDHAECQPKWCAAVRVDVTADSTADSRGIVSNRLLPSRAPNGANETSKGIKPPRRSEEPVSCARCGEVLNGLRETVAYASEGKILERHLDCPGSARSSSAKPRRGVG